MDVAVLGATGDVGRQVCTQLVERALLPATSRLQLVGRAGGASAKATYGLRADLIVVASEGNAPRLLATIVGGEMAWVAPGTGLPGLEPGISLGAAALA